VLVSVVSTINVLASKNTATVRSKMKSSNLFDIRDRIIVLLLRANVGVEILRSLSLESLAEHPKLRETAMLYLLNMLHAEDVSWKMQVVLCNVILGMIGSSEGLKMLCKLTEDNDFATLLEVCCINVNYH